VRCRPRIVNRGACTPTCDSSKVVAA
jgi:hypothetical protein